jgi:hypothetical protein
VSWDSRLAEPIVLSDGIKLASLPSGRALYAGGADSGRASNAAEHRGHIELARIATLQAINCHAKRPPSILIKKPHTGDAAS